MFNTPAPNTQISKSNDTRFREYLISRNKTLSETVFKNDLILLNLEKVLKLHTKKPTLSNCADTLSVNLLPEVFNAKQAYNCRLKLSENFPISICKCKYFKLNVQLEPDPEVTIDRSQRIPVFVSLYSYDSKPQKIENTLGGENIFRGNPKSVLAYDLIEEKHLAHFKLQIREVSSHFIGGLFYFVIEAEQSLDYKNIYVKPLVINNLKVRAKENLIEKV